MIRRPQSLAFVAAVALLLPLGAAGQSKEKAEKPSGTTKLSIEVTAGEKKQPVEDASVYVKYIEKRVLAKDRTIEMNLKTNHLGVTHTPEIPQGRILIQVVAPGWKPFGRWYDVDQTEQTIKIVLVKPPKWY